MHATRRLAMTAAAAVAIAATFTAAGVRAEETQVALSRADSQYVERSKSRFLEFAGSEKNLRSLTLGLRSGGKVTLSGASGSPVSFQSPTRPMGYGNITRALDLASRQLAAAGIEEPTASQLRAALMGGTVSTPEGSVKLDGVLQLRSDGMGWGQIAHTLGVHPGMGRPSHAATPAGSGISTAAGATGGGHSGKNSNAQDPGSVQGKGIVTAAGGAALVHGKGQGLSVHGAAVRSAHGNGAGSSSANAAGNAPGRSK